LLFSSDFGFGISEFSARSTFKISRSQAFTLVELLLVMTIMLAALSISAPLLANFFRGRTLDSEARRLLSLTHGGQSRAVSEGVPMRLWVNPEQGTFGLEEEPGWTDHDPKAVDFKLDSDLQFEVLKGTPKRTSGSMNAAAEALARKNLSGLPAFRFLPDGTVEDTSPRALRIFDRNGLSLWLTQSRNRMNYEIRQDFRE
jgi:prepilin-type N-terminal cleavage/methylation domain-containing protein